MAWRILILVCGREASAEAAAVVGGTWRADLALARGAHGRRPERGAKENILKDVTPRSAVSLLPTAS